MAKVSIEKMNKGRLEQIEIDIKNAILNKKWGEVAKLRAEKAKIEDYFND
ncbi:MAG: hypothetical protein AB6733_10835 [Clostridiaceae bacterium]